MISSGRDSLQRRSPVWIGSAWGLALLASGCQNAIPPSDAQAPAARPSDQSGPPAVDVAVATIGPLAAARDYVGTTQPARTVALRSRVEGYVLDVNADVGDRVTRGQLLARVDARLLAAAAVEAQAEVSAREMEVASNQAQIGEARARVGEAQLRLEQARSDLKRLERLFAEGAIAEQDVETARTAVGTANQALKAARQQVNTREQTVAVARRRVSAQQAIADQARQRQDFARLKSPIAGRILARVLEPGSLAQPGSEILTIGDFSQLRIVVRLSDRDLAGVRLGQAARVRFDAIPNREFTGRVAEISPQGDPVSRQVPVEITLPNPNGELGSGLLARVSFVTSAQNRVAVLEQALSVADDRPGERPRSGNSSSAPAGDRPQPRQGTLFTLQERGSEVVVMARPVQLGDRADGRVQILAGLRPGDRYVLRSSGPLTNGDRVRLSALSDPNPASSERPAPRPAR